jgi:hypothetical protein
MDVSVTAEGLPVPVVWVTYNGEWKVADVEYHARDFTQDIGSVGKQTAVSGKVR